MRASGPHHMTLVWKVLAGLLLAMAVSTGRAGSVEDETAKWLAVIRAIKPEGGGAATNRYNEQLDGAWKFFAANKSRALPILRKELSNELRRESPNQLLLLDVGYYIRLQEGQSDKELGRESFFAIDPGAEIVRWNQREFFEFAHSVVADRDPKTLAFLDEAFLRGGVKAFIPQHALSLDETLVCAFLYGEFGDGAEQHLASQLADRTVANRILEILIWIGSPESVPAVKQAMMETRNYDTFVRATAFMMTAGGPKGRDAMLSVPIRTFDAKSRQYYAEVRRDIEATTYVALQKQFEGFPGPGAMSDADIKEALSAMYRNYGKDDKTSPRAILASGLPKSYLTTQLSRIRSRMFFRVSDEALSDVKMTNAILNALYYRKR